MEENEKPINSENSENSENHQSPAETTSASDVEVNRSSEAAINAGDTIDQTAAATNDGSVEIEVAGTEAILSNENEETTGITNAAAPGTETIPNETSSSTTTGPPSQEPPTTSTANVGNNTSNDGASNGDNNNGNRVPVVIKEKRSDASQPITPYLLSLYLLAIIITCFYQMSEQMPQCQKSGDDTGATEINPNFGQPQADAAPESNQTTAEAVQSEEKVEPVIYSISPPSGNANGNTLVTIKGRGFKEPNKVIFDGINLTVLSQSETALNVKTEPHDQQSVDVAVFNAAGKAAFVRRAYTFLCPQVSYSKLMLLALFAGALGGCLHALRSLWWYAGNRELVNSWIPMYFLLPINGAVIAVIFTWIISSGLMPQITSTSETFIIILALAALVGLFSQQATLKLRQIANAFFAEPGEGKDNSPQTTRAGGVTDQNGNSDTPKIELKVEPDTEEGGKEVTIKGGGYTKIDRILFNDTAVELTPEEGSSTVKFIVPPGGPGTARISVFVDGKNDPEVLTFNYK